MQFLALSCHVRKDEKYYDNLYDDHNDSRRDDHNDDPEADYYGNRGDGHDDDYDDNHEGDHEHSSLAFQKAGIIHTAAAHSLPNSNTLLMTTADNKLA